jgi:hypothetical protein
MIPDFDKDGNLPPGHHLTDWDGFVVRFGTNAHRRRLLAGLKQLLLSLKSVGCGRVFLDGSFISSKELPSDFDGCWDRTGMSLPDLKLKDPVLLDFTNGRRAQKLKYGGEMFPADVTEGTSGRTFINFFSQDKDTSNAKGLVEINLGGLT